LDSILSEKKNYARDEEALQFLLEKQKEDAMELLKSLPESNGVDWEALGNFMLKKKHFK